uniref:Wsv133-like protein n=1 Tax=Metopaulias depressus WSSV-like virus TaxID=1675544 RepID=A0A0K0VL77_9VIRU|nr:wsv133-like protein [Metopaulias depressus WSSV-like virus]
MTITTATVAETVGKEYEFFQRNLSNAMKDEKIPVLRQLCADDPRNNAGGSLKQCNCCGRKGTGSSKEISLEQLIDTAAFIGIVSQIGCLVNSNLSTDCSRLQKQAHSLAALSCDSYIDIVHSKFKDDAANFLEEHQHGGYTEADDRELEYTEATRITRVFEENDFEFDIPTVPIKKKEEEKEEEEDNPSCFMPDLVALYNSDKFESELTRFHLMGAALHAQPLKYDKGYTNYKDNISYTFEKSNCTCSETLVNLLSNGSNGLVKDDVVGTACGWQFPALGDVLPYN